MIKSGQTLLVVIYRISGLKAVTNIREVVIIIADVRPDTPKEEQMHAERFLRFVDSSEDET